MAYADYRDNLMPGVSLADIDREAGVYDPVEDEFWCRGCMLQLTVMGPDGVPVDEFCDDCRAEIEAGRWQ